MPQKVQNKIPQWPGEPRYGYAHMLHILSYMNDQNIRVGFACKFLDAGEINIRTTILRKLTQDSIRTLIAENLRRLKEQFQWLSRHGLFVFRICSDIIPFGSSVHMPIDWRKEFAQEIASAGRTAKEKSLRLSMHPGQYTVLNSPSEAVKSAAVTDLIYHADFLDLMGLDTTCKIVTHIGGVYGDKEQALVRFIQAYTALPANVKARLIVENDDRNYNAEEVLSVAKTLGCPFVPDLYHHAILPCAMREQDVLAQAEHTWQVKDGRMKIHYSEAGRKRGMHSDTITKNGFLKAARLLRGKQVDIMLEVKDKNISALKCKGWLETIACGSEKQSP